MKGKKVHVAVNGGTEIALMYCMRNHLKQTQEEAPDQG
jgi:hypothetical protein